MQSGKLKKRGMMLLSAVLAAFLLTMVASGYFITLTGSFNAIKSGGEALQAQRYAEIEANRLSLMSYDDLDSKVSQNTWKTSDADNNWEYMVKIDPERIIDESKGSKQRIATVSVKKHGDTTERFQMKVPLSIEDSDGNGTLGKREPAIWRANVYNRNQIRTPAVTIAPFDGFFVFEHPRKSQYRERNGEHSSSRWESGSFLYINGSLYNTGDGYAIVAPVKKGDTISYAEYTEYREWLQIFLKPVEYYNREYTINGWWYRSPSVGVIDNCYFMKLKR